MPQVRSYRELTTSTWSHLLIDDDSRKAALIDPVWEFDPASARTSTAVVDSILDDVESLGLELEWILETHVHADHLTCGAVLRERTGAKLAIGRGVLAIQRDFARVYDLADFPADGRQYDRLFEDDEVFTVGNIEVRAMPTPGHTRDCLTYVTDGAAFIGDTLFAPDTGSARCDFPGGDAGLLYESVQRIHALPDGTRLYLCHDYPPDGREPRAWFPVEESRAHNVHLNEHTRREDFIAMREARDATLPLPRLILPALQVNIRGGAPPEAAANGVRYLKIPFDSEIAEILGARGRRLD